MSMKFINPEFQVSKSKNKKVIKICFGTRRSGTPCINIMKSQNIYISQGTINDDSLLQWRYSQHGG